MTVYLDAVGRRAWCDDCIGVHLFVDFLRLTSDGVTRMGVRAVHDAGVSR